MTTATVSNGSDGSRDARGRFSAGNRGGPGRPDLQALGDHQRAIAAAVKPAQLQRIVRKLAALAEGGDVGAARALLDRIGGRAREQAEPARRLDLQLPALTDAKGCSDAIALVLAAVTDGRLSLQDGDRIVRLIDAQRQAIEAVLVEQLVQRLDEAEADRGSGREGGGRW